MRDGKDNRLCCHDESGAWSVLPRVRMVVILHIDFSRGVAVGTSFFIYRRRHTDDEAAFSAGIGSELSELGGSMCSSAAGDVNSSLKASRAHAVAIWWNAERAALSRFPCLRR